MNNTNRERAIDLLLAIIIAAVIVLIVGMATPGHSATGKALRAKKAHPAHAYVVVGDSITWGQGTSGNDGRDGFDPLSGPGAFPTLAGVQGFGFPGRCAVKKCWAWNPLIGDLDVPTSRSEVPLGLDTVVLEIGINDLNSGSAPAHVISGLKTLRHEGRSLGFRVVFATIVPPGREVCADWACSTTKPNPDLAKQKADRRVVNRWIRRQGSYVDLHRALRDRTGAMKTRYDSGDGVHPGDLGHQRMAQALRNWVEKDRS